LKIELKSTAATFVMVEQLENPSNLVLGMGVGVFVIFLFRYVHVIIL